MAFPPVAAFLHDAALTSLHSGMQTVALVIAFVTEIGSEPEALLTVFWKES